MKLILLFLFTTPVFSFGQSFAEKSIVGKWSGNYVTTSVTFPDHIKIKDTLTVHDTVNAIFIFNKNNTGKLTYAGNSKDFGKPQPFLFNYKILPGAIIEFYNKRRKIYSRLNINNDNSLTFMPYPKSEAYKESIELFYDIKYVKSN